MLKIYSLYSFFLLCLLAGCSIDREITEKEAEGKIFMLNYSTEADEAVTVKSDTPTEEDDDENHIGSIFIFFFEHTTNQTGKLLNIYNVTLKDSEAYNKTGSIPIDLTHEDYYNIEASGNYNLLITANTNYYTIANNYQDSEENREELRGELRDYFLDIWEGQTEKQIAQYAHIKLDKRGIEKNRLPMSGKAVKRATNNDVQVKFSRCVSRMDVIIEDNQYDLVSAAVWNVYPHTNVWDNDKVSYQNEKYINLPTVTVGAKENSKKIKGQLYAFENYVSSPKQNDQTTTCLIVGLKRNDINGETEFFRINMHPPKRMQQLKRNKIYSYTIRKVWGKGKADEQEAYEAEDVLIEGRINGWEQEKFGHIVEDENNILAVSFTSVYFVSKGGTATVDIFTQGPGEITLDESSLPKNINVSLEDKKLTITASANSDEHEGEIIVKFAKLEIPILIVQGGKHTDGIQLSHQTVDAFPAELSKADVSRQIKVTASEAWTAQLYNNPYDAVSNKYKFSFDSNDHTKKKFQTGKKEDEFTIYLHTNNTTKEAQYSFVMISLVKNPTISRVLLLTQRTGQIEITHPEIKFTPEGKVPGNPLLDYYDIGVKTDFNWSVTPMHGLGLFEWEKMKPTSETEKEKTVRISAKRDTTGKKKEETFRIHVDGDISLFEDVIVKQDPHIILLSQENGFEYISTDGGDTDWITVTATGPWTASIDKEGYPATLIRQKRKDETAHKENNESVSGNTGETFKVRLPQLTTPFVEPVVTITVKIDDTPIKKEIQIRQKPVKPKLIYLDSWGNNNIGMEKKHHRFAKLAANLRNQDMFGPHGIAEIPGILFSGKQGGTPMIKEGTNIYQTGSVKNKKRSESITIEHARMIKKWLSKPDRIYFFMQDEYAIESIKNLIEAEVLPDTYKDKISKHNHQTSTYFIRFEGLGHPLMMFLLETGPFTAKDDPMKSIADIKINYYTTNREHQSIAYISNWPRTFIPIIIDKAGDKCYLGVDPKHQFVFMGDDELVNHNYIQGTNYKYYSAGKNLTELFKQRSQIINNLFAWMLYVGMYGDDFLKKFQYRD